MGFDGTIAPEPRVQVGLEDSLLIRRLLEHGPVSVHFSATNRIRVDAKIPNGVAELPGTAHRPGSFWLAPTLIRGSQAQALRTMGRVSPASLKLHVLSGRLIVLHAVRYASYCSVARSK